MNPRAFAIALLLAALACASCITRATDPAASTPTSVSRTSPATARESGSLGEKYGFVYASGYPRFEVDADGLATGSVRVLYEADFPPTIQASNFRVFTQPVAGGLQTEPVCLAYGGGLVGEYAPKDKTKIVPATVPVPLGAQEVRIFYTLTITDTSGQVRVETHTMPRQVLTMPAAGDRVPPPKGNDAVSVPTRK